MRARRPLAAAVLAATLATTAPAAATPPAAVTPEETGPRPGVALHLPPGLDYFVDVEITEDAIYLGGQDAMHYDYGSVWRRDLLTGPDGGVVVGNAEWLGRAGFGQLAGTSDAVAWEDTATGGLVVRRDDGTTTHQPATPGLVSSLSGRWVTDSGDLVAVGDPDRRLDVGSLTPPDLVTPPAGWVEAGVDAALASDTVVVWGQRWHDPVSDDWGAALYAQRLDATGPVGEAVLLDQAFNTGAVETWRFVASPMVDDESVAWLVHEGDDVTLRWVAVDALGAAPGERALELFPEAIALDDGRVALHGQPLDGIPGDHAPRYVQVVPLDPTAPELLREQMSSEWFSWSMFAFRGDLVVVMGANGGSFEFVAELDVLSVSGATVQVLPTFPDVTADNPLLPHIDWVVLQGISQGYDDGWFRPYAPVSRQAMAAFLYRAAGSPAWDAPATSPFADLGPGSPFYDEITWLADQGITQGYDGPGNSVLFRPTAPVSRQAMAAFLHRYAGVEADPSEVSPFVDVPTDHEFYGEIAWLADAGISTGTALGGDRFEFRPAAPVSRQAMAAFLHRMDGLGAPA